MAKKNSGLQDVSKDVTNSFVKGLNKDSEPSYVTEGMWTHAINATNSTIEGDLGSISNESSNYLCGTSGATMPTTVTEKYIIGGIHLYSDKWVIYTAGHDSAGRPISSEIGLFETDSCTYRIIVQDACLGFDKRFLISGSSREKEDCTWQVYWADGNNPDRFLNVGDSKTWPDSSYQYLGDNYYSNGVDTTFLWPGVQWNEECKIVNDCDICNNINTLNCDKIRLARLMETPCLSIELGESGGTIANGTYFALIAYTINGQKVTDYFSQSNNQFVWAENDLSGSLTINVKADTENFDEFVCVLVQNVNQGTVAIQLGFYPTTKEKIVVDQINASLISIPIEQLPVVTPVFETSDQITDANGYLLRMAPRSKFDFNYQPLANLIKTKWASAEYPAEYYNKGGNKGNYLRDEVYSFFIRWVYDTGDKSSSYHIPGRAPKEFQYVDQNGVTQTVFEDDVLTNQNSLTEEDKAFEVINTASITTSPLVGSETNDGGKIIAVGDMGYWESTEEYPKNRPDIWNPSEYCWTGNLGQSTEFDLCGKPIRHHKFPSDFINNSQSETVVHFKPNADPLNNGDDFKIRLLGVFFENIVLPKDQDGNDIPGIVGYEILRGSREGNKSILAKGMVNNFRTFKFKGSVKKNQTGLYQNYPFNSINPLGYSTDSSDHNYNYNDPYIKNTDDEDEVINQDIPTDIFTFHSPETTFRNPFLNTTEFKLYGHISGISTQQFKEPSDHPEFRMITNAALIPMIVGGIAATVISLIGKKTEKQQEWTTGSLPGDALGVSSAAYIAGQAGVIANVTARNILLQTYYSTGGSAVDALATLVGGYGFTPVYTSSVEAPFQLAMSATAPTGANTIPYTTVDVELPDWAYLDPISRTLGALNHISYYFSEGANAILELLYAFSPKRQFALQQVSHGFYSKMDAPGFTDLYRFSIDDSFYIKNNFQEVPRYQDNTGTFRNLSINNLKRPETVTIRTKSGPYYDLTYSDGVNIGPKLLDELDSSLVTLGTLVQNGNSPLVPSTGKLPTFKNPRNAFGLPIASQYGGLRSRIRNQYGQLDSVKQVVITPCEQNVADFNPLDLSYTCPLNNRLYPFRRIQQTNILFGGDTYITRYTEKNTMLFYYDWLYNQPDDFEFNYFLRDQIPDARFSINSKKYDVGDLSNAFQVSSQDVVGEGALPSAFYNLDYRVDSNRFYNYTNDKREPTGLTGLLQDKEKGVFSIKQAYFYLANSGIRDFFVETDVLTDFREQADEVARKHYNPYRYTDYIAMFDTNPNIIGQSTDYRYDYSLSISKLYNQYFSQGFLQSRNYDPIVADLCFTYFPDRLIYSLPVQDESVKDSWFIYLINNYKSFKSEINSVKKINDSGIFITFKNESPIMYQGVDTLETDLGTKITIGDGGLFSQPNQNVSAADESYEYGSCQNRLSVISSPVGIFYMSQDQGKIFSYGSGLTEISNQGMKWWFILFMPYKLTEDFPDYPYQDNPVAGIGCQTIYGNASTMLYFCKKDYYLKDEFKGRVVYEPLKSDGTGDVFILDGNQNAAYRLGDERIFEDASWTVSYDPKSNFFVSYHDWHPDLNLGTKDYFISTKNNTLWRHNYLCNSFCNYYGKQHGFEIEIPSLTGQNVVTLRSLTYIMECYRRSGINCIDQHHVLDYNFDQAVIYNSEQVSGYLNLNTYPKNNIVESLKYPKLASNLSSYDILSSKEEQKYRFNQFWDITKDRAEFPIGSDYPPTGPVIPGTTILQGNYDSQNTWVTPQNGYKRVLNQDNLDYNKSELQRKKFRHYTNFITLTRKECNDINMILKIINTKNQMSPR